MTTNENTISIHAKKELIRHVLQNHRMKVTQCVWILSYLLNNENTLKNVSFTEKAETYPRGMLISTIGTMSLPFRYYNTGIRTADAEYAFHDIRIDSNEKIYIELDYLDKQTCPYYAAVFESSPVTEIVVDKESKKIADRLIFEMESRLVKAEYDRLINAALDTGDNGAFMYLTTEFKKMGEEV